MAIPHPCVLLRPRVWGVAALSISTLGAALGFGQVTDEPRVTLDLTRQRLPTALDALFQAAHVPYRLERVTRKELNGEVTIRIRDIPISTALRILLRQTGSTLTYRRSPDGSFTLERPTQTALGDSTAPPRPKAEAPPASPRPTGAVSEPEFASRANIAPSGAEISLSELDPAGLVHPSGEPRLDRSVFGGILGIGGKKYPLGVGVRANCRWDIEVSGKAQSFRAVVGIDDGTGGRGTVEFLVFADGKLLTRTGILRAGRAVPIHVGLANCQRVTLVVTDAGDRGGSDEADWCDAIFRMADEVTIPKSVIPPPGDEQRKWIYPLSYPPETAQLPVVKLPLLFISAADDDGKNGAELDPVTIPGVIRYLNRVFARARVEVTWDPATGYRKINRTSLNRDFRPDSGVYSNPAVKPPQQDVARFGKSRDALLDEYRAYFPIVARRGSDWVWDSKTGRWEDLPTGLSYGGGIVVMAATPGNPPDFPAYAHEMGHSLGLDHTFGPSSGSVEAAARLIQEAIGKGLPPERGEEVFRGVNHYITDVAADPELNWLPGRRLFVTWPELTVPVKLKDGTTRVYHFKPDPFNLMSYYPEGGQIHPTEKKMLANFSPQQSQVLRRRAEAWLDDLGLRPDHSSPPEGTRLDFEKMRQLTRVGSLATEDLWDVSEFIPPKQYRKPNAVPGKQIRARTKKGDKVVFEFSAPEAGSYELWWAGTYGPDFGCFAASLNEEPLFTFDAWTPQYMGTGWRRLGERSLKKGANQISVTVTGKNKFSTNHHFACDALVIRRITTTSAVPATKVQQ